MYEITIENHFAAAHRLREYDGNCEKLHGHNWRVELSVCSENLNDIGLAIDFREAKSILKQALQKLDHAYLNDLETFAERNPSCELIAEYIFDTVQSIMQTKPHLENVSVSAVRVWESPGSSVTYRRKVHRS